MEFYQVIDKTLNVQAVPDVDGKKKSCRIPRSDMPQGGIIRIIYRMLNDFRPAARQIRLQGCSDIEKCQTGMTETGIEG
jgi:hypothetical protein